MCVTAKFRGMVAVALLLTIVSTATAKYGGGSGTADDPYQIAAAADLIALGETPEDYDKHFILIADIDLDPNLPGGKVFDNAVIAPGKVLVVPLARSGSYIVFDGTAFTGVFDGNGHTISNLSINGGDYLGLFGGAIGTEVQIKNLGVVAVNIIGAGDYVGGLAGAGSSKDCYVNGSVSGRSYVGGLMGSGSANRCHSTAVVSGDLCVGGLLGSGIATHCYSTGEVGGGWNVGGLVGGNEGTVSQCYSTGAVHGNEAVGGLVGNNARPSGQAEESPGEIVNCYSTGNTDGSNYVGGLVGRNPGGPVTSCYSTGLVSGSWNVGGLAGSGHLAVNSAFWDMQTSGQATSDGGTGLTTAEMQTAATFLDAGWDFVGETANGTEDIWKIGEGLGYPRLSWEKYSGGTGEPNDPYQIATAADLITLGNEPNDYGMCFILIADIDLDPNLPGRKVFDKAVIAPDTDDTAQYFQGTPFTGVFHGNGYAIRHLTINGSGYLGLFGQLGSYQADEVKVRDLGVVEVNIAGSGDFIDGLAGSNDGSINTSYSSGSISGNSYVGGLVGASDGSVTHCCSTSTVTGTGWSIGGLVGVNGDSVIGCYCMGAVDGEYNVGGLVGDNHGGISTSFSTGRVNGNDCVGGLVASIKWQRTVNACFWDIESSGQAASAGGAGKTTAEMQTASTFLDAGWDFVGETANGTEDIWWILEGQDYPRLWWELVPEN